MTETCQVSSAYFDELGRPLGQLSPTLQLEYGGLIHAGVNHRVAAGTGRILYTSPTHLRSFV